MTSSHWRRQIRLAAALSSCVIGALIVVPMTSVQAAPSTTVVVNEIYGGGGNSGAPFTNDFVELRNIGTSEVDVTGWSVQYASAGGSFSSANLTPLSGTIPAGGYYLVQEGAGATPSGALPKPDAVGSISMGATAGKVALSDGSPGLTCAPACTSAAGVVDYVGYGATANGAETAPAPAPSNASSISRDPAGADTDNNLADFMVTNPPSPQGCSSTDTCSVAPPPTSASIAEIQGAGHISPLAGLDVADVNGVITARRGNGFYLQDPRGSSAPGYMPGASSAIFVFTGSTPPAALAPGTSVTVSGRVTEFRPGGATSPGLTVTEITSPVVTSLGAQPVPAATLIGPGGLMPPSNVIDDDAGDGPPLNVENAGSFDPAGDGIDFWESLEAMRLELDDARVVGPTNTTFGEVAIAPEGSGTASARGGLVLQQDDLNPERLILDNGIGTGVPTANVGDTLTGPTLGVLDYEFNNYHLMATAPATLASTSPPRESAATAANDELSVATFNVENLDPNDPPSKFAELAGIVVHSLKAPDLVALEEVQDNDGPTDSGTVAADLTLDRFTAAIEAAGGPSYTWQQINPVNDAEGGEPGGNIRVAFLVRDGTPLNFVERDRGDSTTDTDVTLAGGAAALTHSPGRVGPGDSAWAAARVPLAGEFTFGGQRVFVVANHWSSKGGDQPLFGRNQPPFQSSEAKRVAQAEVVTGFVDEILSVDPDANVVVLGDLNDFVYSDSVTALRSGGLQDLVDLPATLPVPERYTYVFEGNSQVLDHIVISPALAAQGYDYDIVHVNAEYSDQASDHDPQVVNLHLGLNDVALTASASPARLVYGETTSVGGRLIDSDAGTPIVGAAVALQTRDSAADPWTATGDATATGADGEYAFTVTPQRNVDYRVVFGGDLANAPTASPAVHVDVAARLRLIVSSTSVKHKGSVLFTGLVTPNHAHQTVLIQRLVAGAWRTQASVTLDCESLYEFRWDVGKEKKGDTIWRVVKPADTDHVQGVSREVTITVV